MSSATTRPYFIEKNLLYLFSYDIDLQYKTEEIGFVPGGVRVNVRAKPGTRVYHVLNESTVMGERTLEGKIVDGGDWAFIREDGVGIVDVRLSIETRDHAFIDSTYTGMFPLGPDGFRRFVEQKEKLGNWKRPFPGKVFVTPRYETSDEKYKWLTQHQCVGWGTTKVVDNRVIEVSLDIYAMD